MYAIIKTGGKQYRVSEGDVLNIEKLDVEAGSEVVFDEVLTVVADSDVKIGKPVVDGAKVTAKVVEHGKAEKIFVFKYKAKSLLGFYLQYHWNTTSCRYCIYIWRTFAKSNFCCYSHEFKFCFSSNKCIKT